MRLGHNEERERAARMMCHANPIPVNKHGGNYLYFSKRFTTPSTRIVMTFFRSSNGSFFPCMLISFANADLLSASYFVSPCIFAEVLIF